MSQSLAVWSRSCTQDGPSRCQGNPKVPMEVVVLKALLGSQESLWH